ncbi:hypothetical protein BT69DRAFT_1317542 [Atractiella rhizophila]|nr:hypothetical protein BT69DRAFT_1317542 [Atractiella rhizophila]
MVNLNASDLRQRAGERWERKVEEVKSKSTSISAWKLPRSKSTYAPDGVDTNADMDPTPPWQRTWGFWTWGVLVLTKLQRTAAYWFSDLLTATIWQKAASIVALGLDWRQSMGIMALGSFLLSIPMVLNGAMGAYLHIPFPMTVRTSFGYYFSLFAVVSRLILSWFWFGINTWNGGSAITGMIRAIWPSYAHFPNHLPKGGGVTSQQLLSYFLFWLLQYPFLLIHPSKLRFLFILKVLVVPAVMIATVAWIADKAGGGGALLAAKSQVHGTAFTHAWLFSLNSVIGGYSTVAVNIPDFSRYTKRPLWQWFQLVTLPFFYLITGLFGIIGASCSHDVYGTYLWSPFAIIAKWDSRAAVFFASAAWAVAQISVNVTGNTISGANVHVGSIEWIFLVGWLWGIVLTIIIYSLLSYFWPPTETFVDAPILATFPEKEDEDLHDVSSSDLGTKEKDHDGESLREKEKEDQKERVLEASAPFAHGHRDHLDKKERELAV